MCSLHKGLWVLLRAHPREDTCLRASSQADRPGACELVRSRVVAQLRAAKTVPPKASNLPGRPPSAEGPLGASEARTPRRVCSCGPARAATGPLCGEAFVTGFGVFVTSSDVTGVMKPFQYSNRLPTSLRGPFFFFCTKAKFTVGLQ